jgi:hypothetical protein
MNLQLLRLVAAMQKASESEWTPAALFASGEQGAWYDPSDFSTMFQDTAGTVPVTAVGQSVARINDKSGRGNHATQATSASRPLLSARVSRLTKTEQFDDAVWAKTGATIDATQYTAPNGTLTADRLIETATTAIHRVIQSATFTSGVSFKAAVYVKAAERNFARLGVSGGAAGLAVAINLTTGALSSVVDTFGNYTGVTAAASDVGNGWWLLSLTATRASGGSDSGAVSVGASDALTASGSYAGDGASGIYIWGADLRVANDGVGLPAYQRVNTAADYDTVGFPQYLLFDGVDDGMATASIDFTATDKMTVLAGVRKLSDAAEGSIAELSATLASNNGTFRLTAPEGAAATLGFTSKGTAGVVASIGSIAAPATRVVTGLADISGDSVRIDINGVDGTPVTTDQGTGNFGNYPLYIGARNNASVRFNGRVYSLIVRGAASTTEQITAAETWVNGKTGAY